MYIILLKIKLAFLKNIGADSWYIYQLQKEIKTALENRQKYTVLKELSIISIILIITIYTIQHA